MWQTSLKYIVFSISSNQLSVPYSLQKVNLLQFLYSPFAYCIIISINKLVINFLLLPLFTCYNLSSYQRSSKLMLKLQSCNISQAALCTTIDHLVRYLCTVLNYDLSLSDEILRLLIDYRWDADSLVDCITAGRITNITDMVTSSSCFSPSNFNIEAQSYRNLFKVLKKVDHKKVINSRDFGLKGALKDVLE